MNDLAPGIPALPLEVYEHIIDTVGTDLDDVETYGPRLRRTCLYNCALTCRAWLHRSLHHLYRDIYIQDLHALNMLSRVVREPQMISLSLNTRKLRLHEWRSEQGFSSSGGPRFVHLVPLLLGKMVANVEALDIAHFKRHRTPLNPAFFIHFSAFASLAHLEFADSYFATFHDLQHLVGQLRSLTDLHLRDCTWVQTGFSHREKDFDRPQLRCLRLSRLASRDCTSILQWLLHTPSPQSMRTLSILNIRSQHNWDDVMINSAVLQQFLSLLASTLESLELPGNVDLFCNVNLSQLTNLRSLVMQSVDSLDAFSDMLTTITGSNLCALHLELHQSRIADKQLRKDELNRLDQILASDNFRQTNIVRLDFDSLSAAEENSTIEWLPLLHGRGFGLGSEFGLGEPS